MATPITWHNIHGASLAEASRPMEAAQRSFNGAFDQISEVLKQREQLDAANAATLRNNNTQSYLNQVSELGKTPEALQEAIKSGALDKIRASFGNAIDHTATRGAAEALLDTRYKQVAAANAFSDTERDRTELVVRDQIASLTAQGKTKEAQALLTQHELRKEADLYAGVDTRGQVEVQRGRDTTEFDQRRQKHAAELKAAAKNLLVADANIRQSDAAAENARGSLALNRDRFQQESEDRITTLLTKNRQEMGSIADTSAGSSGGSKMIYDEIAKIKDPDTQNNARIAAAKLIATPGMTTGAALASVMGIQPDNWYTLESTMRDRVQKSAKDILATPEAIAAKENGEIRKALLFEENLKLKLKEARLMKDTAAIKDLEAKLKQR